MDIYISGRLARIGLLGCATLVAAAAQECSNADFSGRYAQMARVSILGMDAQQNNWISGTVVADGEGNLTEWKDTFVVVPPGTPEPVVIERDLVADAALVSGKLTYEVTTDCRMTMTLPGPEFTVSLTGGLAHGGKEFFGIQTSPPTAVAGGVFRSIDAPSAVLVTEIRGLLRRVAARLGLVP